MEENAAVGEAANKLQGTFGINPFIFYLEQNPKSIEIRNYLEASTHQHQYPNIFIGTKHIGDIAALRRYATSELQAMN
ncbi:uncharacterized protein BYT42DRAFT_559775 [Radiomyces spectabilis]|uniref:uncharacterized protein n=1 Tax=Radiomyces spectabilis TaxID=64574 RepID=UPI00221E77CC|nr:uncharacterized protein BYT42DRAFT_559775 [Radiomyces spectabilis]KAI8388344.1 hypothetical protein BYT42DRAFT_559775 [Radiomyces spectabilis]